MRGTPKVNIYQPIMATYIGANSNVFGMVKSILNIWAIRNQASAEMQKKVQRLSKATKIYVLVNVTIFNRISYVYRRSE